MGLVYCRRKELSVTQVVFTMAMFGLYGGDELVKFSNNKGTLGTGAPFFLLYIMFFF